MESYEKPGTFDSFYSFKTNLLELRGRVHVKLLTRIL